MKKLLFPLFLSLSLLFTGCNSIYENHHRTTKVIINLPKITTSSSRKIYDSDIELSSDDNIEFTITLTSGSSEFNLTAKKGESIVFSNIPVGPCTITGLVSAPGLPDFAFGQIRQTIKLGTNNIDLTLSRNLLDNIEDIKVLKDISKTTYELGEPIDDNGAIYAIVLKNGYSFEYNKNELYSLEIGAEVRFKKCDEDEYNNNNRIVPDTNPNIYHSNNADRYYFIIDYHLFNKTKGIDFNKYSYATINAKTPVITKQPESRYIERNSAIKFDFSVTIQNSNEYGELYFDWDYTSPFGASANVTPTAEVTENTDYNTKTSKYSIEITDPSAVSLLSSPIQCIIKNTDTEGGLNGNTEAINKSKRVTLFNFDPNKTVPAYNQNFTFINSEIKYANNTTFVYNETNNMPSRENFRVLLSYKDTSGSSSTQTVEISADDSLITNFSIEKKYDDFYITFGYVPYEVNYTYTSYTYDQTNKIYIPSEEKHTETVYVPTMIQDIPDYELSLVFPFKDKTYEIRYYDPTRKTVYYKDDTTGNFEPLSGYDLNIVQINTVSANAVFYESIGDSPKNIQAFICDFKAERTVNNKSSVHEIFEKPILQSSYMGSNNFYSNIKVKANDTDYQLLENEDIDSFSIHIRCDKTINSNYKSWFINKDSLVTKYSPAVTFKYTN